MITNDKGNLEVREAKELLPLAFFVRVILYYLSPFSEKEATVLARRLRTSTIFEDPESGNTLSSLTDSEPTNDLQQIEGLFYA